MSLRASVLAVVVVGLLGTALGSSVQAQYYRWTDERGNSHYTDGLHAIPERYRSTAVPLRLRPSPPPAPAPASAAPSEVTAKAPGASPDAIGGTSIRYTPGRPILVDVTINARGQARLVLDAEAEVTQIKPAVLVSAGVALPTDGGQARPVMLDSLAVGEARVNGLSVVAQDVRAGEDGLLGRDFLDRFTVADDRAQGVLTLTPR
jgi:hypothetical protein